jgi:hypothetical protein
MIVNQIYKKDDYFLKEVMIVNQIYKKDEYVVIPVENNFIVINTRKVFEDGHSHTKTMGISRLLIDLAIRKELPKNPGLVDSLIRISKDENYIKELQQFKEDEEYISIEDMMKHDSYKRVGRAIRRMR